MKLTAQEKKLWCMMYALEIQDGASPTCAARRADVMINDLRLSISNGREMGQYINDVFEE